MTDHVMHQNLTHQNLTRRTLMRQTRQHLSAAVHELLSDEVQIYWENMPTDLPMAGRAYARIMIQPAGQAAQSFLHGPSMLTGRLFFTICVPLGSGTAELDRLVDVIRDGLAMRAIGFLQLAQLEPDVPFQTAGFHCLDCSLTFTAWEASHYDA